MGALGESWRGTKASACWIAGVPFVNRRILREAKGSEDARRLMAEHCERFLKRCGVMVELHGPPQERGVGCVLCYNETSFADVMAFTAHMWPHVDKAAAADLYAWFPFARSALEIAEIEMVARGNRQQTDVIIDRMVSAAQQGSRVAWGGEGRLSGTDGVLRFKIGASLIAIRAGVPIVPVVYHGGHQVLPLGSLRARSGTIHVGFGEPISSANFTENNARELSDLVQAEVARMYAEIGSRRQRLIS